MNVDNETLCKELVRFWRQYGILLSSGVPVIEALEIQSTESGLAEVRDAIADIQAAVRNGKSMSKALEPLRDLFSAGVKALCRAGEAAGTLEVVAERIATGLEKGALDVSGRGGEEPAADGDVAEAPDADVIESWNRLIQAAICARASAIHLEPTRGGGQVRLRIDGVMQPPDALDRETYDALVSRTMLAANVNLSEKRLPQDGRILLSVEGRELDLRVSFSPYINGYSAVIRILDRKDLPLGLDRMGASDQALAELRRWTRESHGMFIVTGPTGSGKTTALYAILLESASPGRKVMTVEDPVEFIFDGVLQAHLQTRRGLTFPVLIRSFLRQDPDVIMVGEIRDRETAELCVAASLTGHVVLTTLHTETATAAPGRLADMGLPGWLLRDALKGVACMRLVRKVCPECKEPCDPEALRDIPDLPEDVLSATGFVRGKGCERCCGTGYRGRMALFETLPMTPDIRGLIASDASAEDLRRGAKDAGMTTLLQDAARKAAEGLTTLEEAMRVAGRLG